MRRVPAGLVAVVLAVLGTAVPDGAADFRVAARTSEVEVLALALARCDGRTPDVEVASHLEALGSIGPPVAATAIPAIVALLPERAPLYRDRDKPEVERLRAFLLVTLTRLGPPPSEATPFVLAELAGAKSAYSFAAAARTAGALRTSGAVPLLLRALDPEFHDDLVSLERYRPDFPPEEATTAALEAVRALGRMGPAAVEAVPRLREVVERAGSSPRGSAAALAVEARKALAAIAGEPSTRVGEPRATQWLPPERRPSLKSLEIPVVDQNGESYPLARLADRPLALTFFYTRCDNPNRCAMTVSAMVRLQRAMEREGLGERVRLLLATYEPQADTPAVLKRFGADRGFRFGPGALMLRPDPARAAELLNELEAPVNFSAGWVNVHGLVLYLFDAHGRYVRTYHALLWDSDEVLHDLQALAAEPR